MVSPGGGGGGVVFNIYVITGGGGHNFQKEVRSSCKIGLHLL